MTLTVATKPPGTLIDYAEQIKGRNAWSFWWD